MKTTISIAAAFVALAVACGGGEPESCPEAVEVAGDIDALASAVEAVTERAFDRDTGGTLDGIVDFLATRDVARAGVEDLAVFLPNRLASEWTRLEAEVESVYSVIETIIDGAGGISGITSLVSEHPDPTFLRYILRFGEFAPGLRDYGARFATLTCEGRLR